MDIVMGKDKDRNSHIHYYVRQDEKSMKCFMCGHVHELTEEQMACDHRPKPGFMSSTLFDTCGWCNVPNPMQFLVPGEAESYEPALSGFEFSNAPPSRYDFGFAYNLKADASDLSKWG